MAKRPKTKLDRRGTHADPHGSAERPHKPDHGPQGPSRPTGSDTAASRGRPATKLPRR